MHVKCAGWFIRRFHRLFCALLDENMIFAYRMQLHGRLAV